MTTPKSLIKNLQNKQSERTTFKLPETSFILLKVLSHNNKISQKEVLASAAEYIQHSDEFSLEEVEEFQNTSLEISKNKELKKTLVISKGTLDFLEKNSKKIGASRDTYLNFAIFKLFSDTFVGDAYSIIETELNDNFLWSLLDHVSSCGCGEIVEVVEKKLTDYPDLQKEILEDLEQLSRDFNEKMEDIEQKLRNQKVNKFKMIEERADEND